MEKKKAMNEWDKSEKNSKMVNLNHMFQQFAEVY